MQCSCYKREGEICRECYNRDIEDYEKEIRKLKKMVSKRDATIKHIRKTIRTFGNNYNKLKRSSLTEPI